MAKDTTTLNISKVRRLCEGWAGLSLDEFRELLASDCVYIDVPFRTREAIGPDAAFEKLSSLKNDWHVSLEVVNIAGSEHAVLAERVEHFHNLAGKVEDCVLRCAGVFELADGKITAWRDYWNLADAEPLMRYASLTRS
jgi:limonene-1,2-epoxide hydrolase